MMNKVYRFIDKHIWKIIGVCLMIELFWNYMYFTYGWFNGMHLINF